MNLENLLIVDIAKSFIFSSLFTFEKERGYKFEESKYSRFPPFVEVNILVDKFLSQAGYKDKKDIIYLVDKKKHFLALPDNTILRSPKYWQKNIKILEQRLSISGITFVDISLNEIIFATKDELISDEFDIRKINFPFEIKKYLQKSGLNLSMLNNYFDYIPPLPFLIRDYQKSFMLGYAFGDFLAKSIDLSHTKYLIVSSEWIKSGFLDKSGFLEGIRKFWPEIKKYSFDPFGIWELLLNDTLDQFKNLVYLNKYVFYPEFVLQVYKNKPPEKLYVFTKTGQVEEYKFMANSQNNLPVEEIKHVNNLYKQNAINIYYTPDFLNIKRLLDLQFFKNWYKMYLYKGNKFIELNFDDKYTHIVDIDNNFLDTIKSNEKYVCEYYNLFGKLKSKNKYEVLVVPGQYVNKKEILAKRTDLAGLLIYEIKCESDGFVEEIDRDNGWLTIRTKSDDNVAQSKFSYNRIKSLSKLSTKIKINGFRIDCVQIYGKRQVAILKKFSKNLDILSKRAALWFGDINDVFYFMKNINKYQAQSVIIPTIEDRLLLQLLGENNRYLKVISVVILNGVNSHTYTTRQKKFLECNSGKYILIEPDEKSIYTLDDRGKFDSSGAPYHFYPYVKIFTFDDWNLSGKVIYNDEDSEIVRTDDSRIFDVVNYNLISFNKERLS